MTYPYFSPFTFKNHSFLFVNLSYHIVVKKTTKIAGKEVEKVDTNNNIKKVIPVSSNEFISLYADVRLGISLGIIKDIDYKTLGELFINVMPATLTLSEKEAPKGRKARDILRAKRIKEYLLSK